MNNNNPWLGLRTYTENDKIYGRDKEKVQLANLIKNNLHTIIYGKSGVGKSSLLQAGVFPLLRDEDMFPVYMRLEHNSDKPYLEQIKDAVLTASSFRIESRENIDGISNTSFRPQGEISLKQFLTETNFIDDDIRCRQYPVLVLDQFEEIFTLTDTAHKTDVASFFDQIADVLDVQEPCFRIVICLREDYLYYLEQNSVRIPDLKRNRFSLNALNKEQATEIITKPCHGIVADDVVERVLNKVSMKNADEYEPAILSLFMFSLYEKMKSSGSEVISNELVDTFGDNIISNFYNSSTQNISDSSMEFIEEHLLTDGGYRHNIPVDDAHNHGVTDAEIKQLVDNRIVTTTPRANNVDYMEFSHDVLCAVATKSRNERRLRIQKKMNKRRMRIMTGVILAVLVMAGVFIWQYHEMNKRQQAMLTMQSRATVGMVKQNMEEVSVCIAALLEVLPDSIEKPNRPFIYEPVRFLHKLFDYRLDKVWYHNDVVNTAKFSHDGRYVVTTSNDSTARIWDAATGNPVGEPMCHDKFVESATFSPDCRYVVTTSGNIARIWDVATGKPVGKQMRHDSPVKTASFSPDGHYVVTASWDKTVRIWDAATGNPLGKPMRHDGWVNTASFNHDGGYVVSASDDNTARIWNAATCEPVGKPMCHDGLVNTASFNHDGSYVVTASWDRTARIWDATTGNPVSKPMRHDGSVNTASFSPDGLYVVTASRDNTARIWDAATGDPVGKPMSHDDYVETASFSHDGRYVVTASWDKTVRTWDAATGNPIGESMRHDGCVNTASFSPDGNYVATASWDKTARIWDASTRNPVSEMPYHDAYVNNAASFSHDGQYVVTISEDTAVIRDAATWKPVGKPMRHGDRVNTASFSHDGSYVVTASDDKTAKIWDAATGEPVGEPMRHSDLVNIASFNHDSRYVVTASYDKIVRIWNVTTGNPVGKPMHHDDLVNTALFSPDGRYVVTASGDHAIIWDASTWNPVGESMRHNQVNSASFSSDGRYVVTVSSDRTSRIWDVSSNECVYEYYGNRISLSPDMKNIAIVKDKDVYLKPFLEPQELITKCRKVYKNFKLTPEERRKYYLE